MHLLVKGNSDFTKMNGATIKKYKTKEQIEVPMLFSQNIILLFEILNIGSEVALMNAVYAG